MRVLVATDGSPSANLAVDLVGGVTWPADTRIRVIQAIETAGVLYAGPWGAIGMSQASALEERLREVAGQTVDEARARLSGPGREVVAEVMYGRSASAIVDAAADMAADLIVMGSRGYGTIQSMLVGSVSAEVVDQASAPVLLARRPTISRVVLAWDGSACARVAAEVLRTWPIFADCAIGVVSVADIGIPWWSGLPMDGPDQDPTVFLEAAEESRRLHRTYATEMADELRAAGLRAEAHQRDGDAATEVIGAARDMGADLIVMGTRGRTGLTRLVLGSVARNVVNHAECSVLIARDAGDGSSCAPPAS